MGWSAGLLLAPIKTPPKKLDHARNHFNAGVLAVCHLAQPLHQGLQSKLGQNENL